MPRKSKFTDEQIIRALREIDGGARQADIARKLGVNDQTIYRWRQKFGGMDVSEAKRLRALEDENTRLKKLLADTMLDKEMLQTALAKKW
jgi:putative transposase